jgi:hypothetical protein
VNQHADSFLAVVTISQRRRITRAILWAYRSPRPDQLVVSDAATGRFNFADDNQTYIAPSAINIAPYAGKVVEVQLDEGGRVIAVETPAVPPAPLAQPYISAKKCVCSAPAIFGLGEARAQ